MKIGILSDIHGNHYALKEVLNDAKNYGINHLLILGDIVGYYYWPDKVLELLARWNYNLIKGNHEEILINILDDSLSIDRITEKYGSGHKFAINNLPASALQMLRALPVSKELTIDGVSILMTHGSPWSTNLYIYPDIDIEKLSNFDDFEYDFVLFGHTHYSCCFKTKNGIALNPGSVGQSREKGGVAYWAVINTNNNMVQFKVTKYNTTRLKADVLKIDPGNSYNLAILDR